MPRDRDPHGAGRVLQSRHRAGQALDDAADRVLEAVGEFLQHGAAALLLAQARRLGGLQLLRGILQRHVADGHHGAGDVADLVPPPAAGHVGEALPVGERLQGAGERAERRHDRAREQQAEDSRAQQDEEAGQDQRP